MTTIARTMMTTHRSRVLLRVRNAATPYTFVGPIVALAFFFYFVPIFGAFNLSLKRWLITTGRDPEFIGFENYIELFSDQYFYGAFWNTVQFVIGLVPIGIVLSLGLALLLNLPIRFRAGFRAIFFIPVVIPTVVVAMIWSFMFAPYGGVINGLLESLGFQAINWLSNPDTAMNGIIVASLWKAVGFNMVIFLAGLQSIPREYYEAAMIDGATSVKSFFYITLPLLKPTMLFAVVIATIHSFQVFTQVFVMTGGGPAFSTTTLVHYIYLNAFEYFRLGFASTAAVSLFILLLLLTLLQLWLLRSKHYG